MLRLQRFAASSSIKNRILDRPRFFSVVVPTTPTAAAASTVPVLDFSDTQNAYKNKTLHELIRGTVVFSICQIKPIVIYADKLIKLSYMVVGSTATDLIL
jgi:hypothetical protein